MLLYQPNSLQRALRFILAAARLVKQSDLNKMLVLLLVLLDFKFLLYFLNNVLSE